MIDREGEVRDGAAQIYVYDSEIGVEFDKIRNPVSVEVARRLHISISRRREDDRCLERAVAVAKEYLPRAWKELFVALD